MNKLTIEQIVPHLPEVGNPMQNEANRLKRKQEQIDELQKALDEDRVELEASVKEAWSAGEVKFAKARARKAVKQ